MNPDVLKLAPGDVVKDPTLGFGVVIRNDKYERSAQFVDRAIKFNEQLEPGPTSALKGVREILTQAANKLAYCTTGSDPEIFAFKENGEVIPAWLFLPRKHDAERNLVANKTQFNYWDGVQAEITTTQGFGCHAHLVDSIQDGLAEINMHLKKYDPTAYLGTKDVVEVPEDVLMNAEEEHVALGCAPSQNIHGIPPIDVGASRQHPLRYSGVHLHYRLAGGFDDLVAARGPHYPDNILTTMDRTVGVLLTALGRGMEDPRRRAAYGRPGEYRMTAPSVLGIEYRTPGSFLLSRPEVFNFALDMGRHAYHMGVAFPVDAFGLGEATDLIMNCDADAAYKHIIENKPFFEKMLVHSYGVKAAKTTFDLLKVGLKQSGLVTNDVASMWQANEGQSWGGHSNNDRSTWRYMCDKI